MAVSFSRIILRKQRGVALITALLVVALATITAVAMASRQQLDVRRTGNLLQGDQAYAYALAVESWARVVLLRDAKDNLTDSLGDDWAQQLPPLAVPGGQVGGFVLDLQGRFNLYNLVKLQVTPENDPDVLYFQNLLRVLGLDDQLVWAIMDWVDADFETRFPGGAEDDVYQSSQLPYRAANRPFQSVSELRLVTGIDAATWNALAPYVCALPSRTSLNVNTAAAPLIQALSEEFSQQDAGQLIEGRGENGYESVDKFVAQEAMAGRKLIYEASLLSVTSAYYLARADIVVGGAHAQLYSVLHRDKAIETLARSQGTW